MVEEAALLLGNNETETLSLWEEFGVHRQWEKPLIETRQPVGVNGQIIY